MIELGLTSSLMAKAGICAKPLRRKQIIEAVATRIKNRLTSGGEREKEKYGGYRAGAVVGVQAFKDAVAANYNERNRLDMRG